MRAFLFDLDGTLVDSERENAESIARVLGARGRPLSDGERDFVVGHGWHEIYVHLQEGRHFDLSYEELKTAAAEEKERMVLDAGLRILPGAVEYVRRAATVGPCTVVSGSSRREIDLCIRLMGLTDVIRWYVGAEDVRRGKPSPEGYLAGAAGCGARPSECVVFEDATAGIHAALAAGMFCVALDAGNFAGQDQSAAPLRIHSFGDLGERLFQPGELPAARRAREA